VAKAKKQPFNLGDFLNCVDGDGIEESYRKNQKVYSQGDAADSVFYVKEGKLKVCVTSEQGKEAVVALHGEGDFFGEGCLTGQVLRLATVAASSRESPRRPWWPRSVTSRSSPSCS
jgi:CRP/FNR family transcriptional regulator, cyclic AMP receptor protein